MQEHFSTALNSELKLSAMSEVRKFGVRYFSYGFLERQKHFSVI